MIRIFYITLFCICFSENLKAQTPLELDSMALVALYNQCGGTNWTNNSGWLNDPIDDWEGITVESGRVTWIWLEDQGLANSLPDSICYLSALKYLWIANNSLTGNLPACFSTLSTLNSIDLKNNTFNGALPSTLASFPDLSDLWLNNNDFSDLPDLSSSPQLVILQVANNKFTFDDFVPNVSLKFRTSWVVSPQDSIDNKIDTLVGLRDTISFSASGFGTTYQWYKNGVALSDDNHYSGTGTSTLTILYCTFADSGVYNCEIGHTEVTDLILHRNDIVVKILDNRLSQDLTFFPGGTNVCGDPPSQLLAINSSGLTYTAMLVSGPGKLAGDTLIPFTEGTFVINFANNGDDYYLPLDQDTTVLVALSVSPDVNLQKEIPVDFGERLHLRALTTNTSEFQWITPSKDTVNSYDFLIARAFKEHEGVYTVTGTRNSCFFYKEDVLLQFEKRVKPYLLLTPNGDEKNDVLIIEGILDFPENKITVFNAWQQVVFTKDNYANDWGGEGLPAGTYYLHLNLKETNEIIQSSFVLRR